MYNNSFLSVDELKVQHQCSRFFPFANSLLRIYGKHVSCHSFYYQEFCIHSMAWLWVASWQYLQGISKIIVIIRSCWEKAYAMIMHKDILSKVLGFCKFLTICSKDCQSDQVHAASRWESHHHSNGTDIHVDIYNFFSKCFYLKDFMHLIKVTCQ